MYSGHIYDKFGNPLSGIRVSDGRNITLSKEDGSYTLAGWERANVIFASMLTRRQDDYYRYIDKEHFTYDLYIEPYESDKKSSSFLHISDTEIFIDGASYDKWKDFLLSCKEAAKPDFLIHTGDICRRRGLEEHKRLLNSENFGIPVRYTLGNHDYVNDKYGEYTFERLYGPLWYSFDLANTHYVCLPIGKGETKGLYHPEDCVKWLASDLSYAENKRIVIFCHTYCEESEKDFIIKYEGKELCLKEKGLLAWVFGHLHVNYLYENSGVFAIGTGRPDYGGIDSCPAGCRFVYIDGDKLSSHIFYNEKSEFSEDRVIDERSCFTPPIYTKDGIYTATFSDAYPRDAGIVKRDRDGNIIWKRRIEGAVKYNMAYENGILYAVDTIGKLLALNGDNGHTVFESDIPTPKIHYVPSGVSIAGEKIVVTTGTGICLFNKKSGDLIYSVELTEGSLPQVSHPIFSDGRIYYPKHWSGLYILDEESGRTLHFDDTIKDSVADPIIVGERIFIPTRYGIVCVNKEGKPLYKTADYPECAFDSVSTPIYKDGVIYVATTIDGIIAFDADTLKELYRFECGESLIAVCPYTGRGAKISLGAPIIEEDTLIFTSSDGCVYFYSIISQRLEKVIRHTSPFLSGAVKTDNGYCAVDFYGKLIFF